MASNASITELMTRLGGAADALGVDVSGVIDAAGYLGDEPGGYARISLTDQRRLALLSRWPGGEEVASALRGYHKGRGNQIQNMTLPALLERPAAARFFELETAPGRKPTMSLHLIGSRSLAEDLAMLSKATIFKQSAADDVMRLAGLLGRDASDALIDRAEDGAANLWQFRFRADGVSANRVAEQLRAVMEALKVEDSQRLTFERLHGQLAGDRMMLTLTAGFDTALPWVSIAYGDLSWDRVVPCMIDLYGADWSNRLGALAGAFDHHGPVSSFELRFRDEPPIRARVSIDWQGR